MPPEPGQGGIIAGIVPDWSLNPPGLFLLFGSAILLLLAGWGGRLPPFPGQGEFVRSQFAIAWWSTAAAIENMVTAAADKVLWAEMAWPGIIATQIYWSAFLWGYCKGESPGRHPLVRLLGWLLPLLVWIAALTNPWHHLMYVATTPQGDQPGAPVLYDHGILVFVVFLIAYLLLAAGTLVLADAAQQAPRAARGHYFALIVALLFPWIASIGHLTRTFMPYGFDATPFSFVLTAAVFCWMIGRRQLFVLPPIALRPLVDSLPEAVLVVDGGGRVVEANATAQALVAPGPLLGQKLAEVLPLPLPAAEAAGDDPIARAEIRLDRDGGERHFEIRTRLLAYRGRQVGRVVVLSDITHRKRMERRLRTQLAVNLRLQRKLREQANRDLLTGLRNRHFLEEIRPALLAEADRAGRPLAAALIDLDHFKRLNDTWGHLAGDEVLRAVADYLVGAARESDFVIRVGGEEILILLPDSDGAQAAAAVERWRAAFVARPVPARGHDLAVSFSAGIASYPDEAESWDQLVQRADLALYCAKERGRNQVCHWAEAFAPVPAPARRAGEGGPA